MLAPARSWHRARLLVRFHGRLPHRLRRPGPALRAATIGLGLWFAVLFAALGLGGAGPTVVSAAFVGAAAAGVAGAVLVGVGRLERGLWCLAGMFAVGQVAALTLPW